MDRPRLRPGLAAVPDGQLVVVYDTNRVGGPPLALTRAELTAAEHMTGDRTVADIARAAPGVNVLELTARLDASLFLDSDAFRAYVAGPVRRPVCFGHPPPSPAALGAELDRLFTAPGGPGLPNNSKTSGGRLRAILAPHMDYGRGGVTYGWAFKELAERTTARLFVIVATSHYSPHRFTLTRMNFQTPFGTAETDQAYVNRLAALYGPAAFADPVAHLPEHSVELEVVLLQHLFAGKEPFRIVPLLVGSFGDCVDENADPAGKADIARMVAALRAAEAAAGEEVCYVISGDLAHIGPKFRDPEPVSDRQLADSKTQDERLLDRLAAADGDGFFRTIAAEGDRRRICGLPPAWVTLAAARPRTGAVLKYDRFVHPKGHESVSFAAAAFSD